ncbi:uncharacterized protein LOC111709387 [Eurytemora carolleeae]|uniref:uncharacterized protein LOC111709387 n=1 Tax=Eurytemora carolleeae TaxID=1294199 RepID=UPI000C7785C3|nr:uncharacterized protein LOC111709387 [Eurytemora carolleeae]|eukprot:XP_023338807.1 uncharacterized protein LOC111709387 [Eurytemora affinis]
MATVQNTVFEEVADKKAVLEKLFYKINVLERNLEYRDLAEVERERIEKDLQVLKKELKLTEETLKSLHSENMDGYAVVWMVFLFLVCVYALIRLSRMAHEG